MKKLIYISIPILLIIIFFVVRSLPNGLLNNEGSSEDINTPERSEESVDSSVQENERFSVCSNGSGVVDGILTDSRDNQTYSTVKIGQQCWMSQNLNYDSGCTKVIWEDDSKDAWCGCYDNDSDNCDTYGLLYRWAAATNSSTAENTQGICPNGWHVPSDEEWKTLETFLGMTQEEADTEGAERSSGNVKSKLIDSNHTEYSGFNGLAGGMRVGDGNFRNIGSIGYFLTSTATKVDNYYRRAIDWYTPGVERRATSQSHAFSLRCVRD